MDKKYDNLRSKTIFDFTRDEKIIGKILDVYDYPEYKKNPDEFINFYINTFILNAIIEDIIKLSYLTNDDALYEALKKEYESDRHFLFNFEEEGFIS